VDSRDEGTVRGKREAKSRKRNAELTVLILLVLAGYLLGSIPIAWVVTKMVAGRDLRQLGSGIVGVMNTALSVHRWTGEIVFSAEIAKGALTVILARAFDGSQAAIGLTVLATIIGTRWSAWLGFRGGTPEYSSGRRARTDLDTNGRRDARAESGSEVCHGGAASRQCELVC
jgi:glycerol-3-phosphate acyltransferase-like protein